MDGKHPNRKKDQYNPYILSDDTDQEVVSVADIL